MNDLGTFDVRSIEEHIYHVQIVDTLTFNEGDPEYKSYTQVSVEFLDGPLKGQVFKFDYPE